MQTYHLPNQPHWRSSHSLQAANLINTNNKYHEHSIQHGKMTPNNLHRIAWNLDAYGELPVNPDLCAGFPLFYRQKNPGLFQDIHEKFSRTFLEPTKMLKYNEKTSPLLLPPCPLSPSLPLKVGPFKARYALAVRTGRRYGPYVRLVCTEQPS